MSNTARAAAKSLSDEVLDKIRRIPTTRDEREDIQDLVAINLRDALLEYSDDR